MTSDGITKPIQNIRQVEERFELALYPKRDLEIIGGKGVYIHDKDGKEYIDCASGIGVANVGHCNDYVNKAIQDQLGKIITVPEIFYNDTRAKLLEKLISTAPEHLNRAFLCNSGTESVEAAIKFAKLTTGKSKFISCMRGFHGRTHGSLSATFERKYRQPFEPLVQGFDFVPFGKIERLVQSVDDETAAIIIEVIQGNGGINMANRSYFTKVQDLCDSKGILLIIDEVQTGFGRTGRMFAFEHFNLRPDLVCLAKSIAGGVPMGAVLAAKSIDVKKNLHGSTFGGNPLACAASLATIEYIRAHNLVKKAKNNGAYLIQRLKQLDHQIIRDIRGMGLMVGIELRTRVYKTLQELMDRGIIALPAGSTVIRLLPPLIITKDEIDKVVKTIDAILTELYSQQ